MKECTAALQALPKRAEFYVRAPLLSPQFRGCSSRGQDTLRIELDAQWETRRVLLG